MKYLVIGNTSQLSMYFNDIEYQKISSRNIDYSLLNKQGYERIYICFAEQRTFNDSSKFIEINNDYTINLIDKIISEGYLKEKGKIIIYLTTDLWKNHSGYYNLTTPFIYPKNNHYVISKEMLYVNLQTKKYIDKIVFIYPTNFNSIYRKEGFLFTKVFKSIINETPIEVGNTYFYRDMTHPKFVVEDSINTDINMISNLGKLVFVNDFIRDLYSSMGMNYNEFVIENNKNETISLNTHLKSNYMYGYNDMLELTINELKIEKNLK